MSLNASLFTPSTTNTTNKNTNSRDNNNENQSQPVAELPKPHEISASSGKGCTEAEAEATKQLQPITTTKVKFTFATANQENNKTSLPLPDDPQVVVAVEESKPENNEQLIIDSINNTTITTTTTKEETETLTDICSSDNNKPEEKDKELDVKYKLRAENINTDTDWIKAPLFIDEQGISELTNEQIKFTLDYFILSGYRVSQMTKTYHDIEAVTKLLDEKEKDLEMAATIGKQLLEKDQQLELKIEILEVQLEKTSERVNQLRHEITLKDDLLKSFIDSENESFLLEQQNQLEKEQQQQQNHNNSHLNRHQQQYVRNNSLEASEKNNKIRDYKATIGLLEDENESLRDRADYFEREAKDQEKKDSRLVEAYASQLEVTQSNLSETRTDLAEKTKECRTHQDQVQSLFTQIFELQMRVKTLEKDNSDIQAVKDTSIGDLLAQLTDLKEKYNDCIMVLTKTSEDLCSVKRRQAPLTVECPSPQLGTTVQVQNQQSVEPNLLVESSHSHQTTDSEFETSQMSSSSQNSNNQLLRQSSSLYTPFMPINNGGGGGQSSSSSNANSSLAAELYYTLNKDQMDRSANHLSYQVIQSSDMIRQVKVNNQNQIQLGTSNNNSIQHQQNNPYLMKQQTARNYQCQTPDSMMSTGSASFYSSLLGRSNSASGSSGGCFVLPEKLTILKPLEGSQTLQHWQSLATPNLGCLFESRPGISVMLKSEQNSPESCSSSSSSNSAQNKKQPKESVNPNDSSIMLELNYDDEENDFGYDDDQDHDADDLNYELSYSHSHQHNQLTFNENDLEMDSDVEEEDDENDEHGNENEDDECATEIDEEEISDDEDNDENEIKNTNRNNHYNRYSSLFEKETTGNSSNSSSSRMKLGPLGRKSSFKRVLSPSKVKLLTRMLQNEERKQQAHQAKQHQSPNASVVIQKDDILGEVDDSNEESEGDYEEEINKTDSEEEEDYNFMSLIRSISTKFMANTANANGTTTSSWPSKEPIMEETTQTAIEPVPTVVGEEDEEIELEVEQITSSQSPKQQEVVKKKKGAYDDPDTPPSSPIHFRQQNLQQQQQQKVRTNSFYSVFESARVKCQSILFNYHAPTPPGTPNPELEEWAREEKLIINKQQQENHENQTPSMIAEEKKEKEKETGFFNQIANQLSSLQSAFGKSSAPPSASVPSLMYQASQITSCNSYRNNSVKNTNSSSLLQIIHADHHKNPNQEEEEKEEDDDEDDVFDFNKKKNSWWSKKEKELEAMGHFSIKEYKNNNNSHNIHHDQEEEEEDQEIESIFRNHLQQQSQSSQKQQQKIAEVAALLEENDNTNKKNKNNNASSQKCATPPPSPTPSAFTPPLLDDGSRPMTVQEQEQALKASAFVKLTQLNPLINKSALDLSSLLGSLTTLKRTNKMK